MKDQEKADRENIHDNAANGSVTPFFARFLESQQIETESGAAKDEARIQTLKYPSDRDEDIDPFSRL